MARTKTKTHEVAFRSIAKAPLTKEMVEWLVAHGKAMNENIKFHDPLLVECVKEVKPQGWHVATIKGNKYKLIDIVNDAFLMTPEDVKVLNKSWIVIEDEENVEVPAEKAETPEADGNA